jgi:hypothetical protein
MAGASTPANPGTPTTAPCAKGTPGPEPATVIHLRSRATGQEAENLVEAARRVDAVASVLASVLVDHATAADGLVLPLVKLLDDALRLVERS